MRGLAGRRSLLDTVEVLAHRKRKTRSNKTVTPPWSIGDNRHKASAQAILAHPARRVLDTPCTACQKNDEECVVAPGYANCASCAAHGASRKYKRGLGRVGTSGARSLASKLV